jgi:hypothetical protein
MPRLLGASLGNLLRAGTQAGTGYLAGKQAREEREREQAIQAEQEQRKSMIEMALLEQQQARTEDLRATTEQRRTPKEPDPPGQFELSGMMREAQAEGGEEQDVLDRFLNTNRNVSGALAREALARNQRQQAADERAETGAGRSGASAARSSLGSEERRLLSQLEAFAIDFKRGGADFEAIKSRLTAQFPAAPDWLVILAANEADEGDSFQEMLIRAIQGAGLFTPGGSGGS